VPPPEFQTYQRALARHLRDPRTCAVPPGVSHRGVAIYRELLFSNLLGFLDACFPVTRHLLGPARWHRLARVFFAAHPCRSPLFRHIPEEFARWLGAGATTIRLPGWTAHLAHYEWVELALDTSPLDARVAGADAGADLLGGRPVLNPVSMLLAYPYPVHRIGPDWRPRAPAREPTRILAFRDHGDAVRFIVLNPVSARLVDLLRPGRLTGRGALRRIAAERRHPDPGAVLAGGAAVLADLHAQQAIVGALPTRRRPAGTR
jgi:hypothetical protein